METKQQPLHLKYRPDSFDKLIGNKSIIDSLQGVLARPSGKPHSFMFTGPSGCGKTTLARILGKELGSSEVDIYEYNSANLRGIDTVREIIQFAKYKPKQGLATTFILDEFHRTTGDAQNAILKILEDTPKHVFFIICTTDPEKVLPTIRNRCSSYQVQSLTTRELTGLLKQVATSENAELPETAFVEIAKKANGSPRRALVILDQVIDIPTDIELMNAIQNGVASESELIDICRLLIANQSNKWATMSPLLKNFRGEAEQARYGILAFLSSSLLGKVDDRIANMISMFSDSYMYVGKPGLIRDCYFACNLFTEAPKRML